MIDFSTPLAGMGRAEDRLNLAASRIAQAPFAASNPEPQDTVDLSAEMVSVLQSRNDFTANTKVLKVGDELTRATLDLLG